MPTSPLKSLPLAILPLLAACAAAPAAVSPDAKATADILSLAGPWRVRIDRKDEGLAQHWGSEPWTQAPTATLPGSLTSNHLGDPIGLDTPWVGSTSCGGPSTFLTDPRYALYRTAENFKVPFWLQPDTAFMGGAWYQKEVVIPEAWRGKPLELDLERCHWKTTVFVDGKEAGSCDSLATPHRYTLALAPGRHLLSIRVDNRYLVKVGWNASSVTDHTQTNWNGLIGELSLKALAPVSLERLETFPDLARREVRVKAHWRNTTGKPFAAKLRLEADAFNAAPHHPAPVAAQVEGRGSEGVAEIVLPMGEAMQAWDEFHPALYKLTATLGDAASATTTFGMREIKADGRTLRVNGTPIFLRGTLDCAAFPKTGFPPTDIASWRRIFAACKAHGLNHVRYHSWCPPEAAFAAADLEGMYLQVECGVWYDGGGHGGAAPVEPWLLAETARIVAEYGNHPSFMFLVHGNEPGNHKWLKEVWEPRAKTLAHPRQLEAAGSHHPLTEASDFLVAGCVQGFNYRYQYAINDRPATTRTYEAQVEGRPQPAVAHEPGEWCVFPNFKEIPKYTGCLKARNFEIVREFMAKNHLLARADDFLMASGKFQTAIYKEEIEAFLRTRGSAGFQLLGLNDFPGQGTALVGVLDAFWESKGYVTPEEYRRFCGPVVPLALMGKREWTNDETFSAPIRIAQYSGATLKDAAPQWTITGAGGKTLASGALKAGDIPVGNATELGTVAFPLSSVTQAQKCELTVSLPSTPWCNAWNFWVYPVHPKKEEAPFPGVVTLAHAKDEALAALARGERVLLLPDVKTLAGKTAGTFAPIFWNKAWFPGQREHTLGQLIRDKHPALADFPTDSHADWQWWELMSRSKPLILDALPADFRPIVEPIDDWNTCRRLGTLLEAQVGRGRLLLCAMDLESDLSRRPVAAQLRRSLLAYAASGAFQPKDALTEAQVAAFFRDSKAAQIVANPSASSGPAAIGFDDDPETVWSSAKDQPYPHTWSIAFTRPTQVSGVAFLPRQGGKAQGWVKEVEIQVSDDGKTWRTAAKETLLATQEWKKVAFPARTARFLRIVALSPQDPKDGTASFAEIVPDVAE